MGVQWSQTWYSAGILVLGGLSAGDSFAIDLAGKPPQRALATQIR